jgi:hypothetical protein
MRGSGRRTRTRRERRSTMCSANRHVELRGVGRRELNKPSAQRPYVTVSRPVGGVLFALAGEVAIHLSGLPGDCSRGAGEQPMSHVRPCSGWGLPSRPSHPGRWCALAAPFHPCLFGLAPVIGGLLSVALSFGSPRLAVSQHPALWSPDLPRHDPRPRTSPRRGHPADSPSRSVCQVIRHDDAAAPRNRRRPPL